jgi:predicted nucleic acid-binding protein
MILVDTGPIVALCDPRDARHVDAVSHLGRLASRGLGLCDAVLAEACFHLPHRAQRQRLQSLMNALPVESLPTHDTGFRSDVFDWLIRYAEHEPDWADGCLAVLSGGDRTLKVWTYDREFHTTWRRPDGTAIPLAVRG